MAERARFRVRSHLLREWTVCGIAFAAARFLPVPFLDDAVRARALRIAIVRTLRAHGRTYPSDWVEPLHDPDAGRPGGMLRRIGSTVRTVVLFPIRKYVAIFGAVRGVPTDVMTVLLLGRTVSRWLERGGLDGTDRKALAREAGDVRRAFVATLDEMDLRLLSGAVAEALSQAHGLTGAAVEYARRSFAHENSRPHLDPEGEVGEAASRVERLLRRQDIRNMLAEFEARVDARLAASYPDVSLPAASRPATPSPS